VRSRHIYAVACRSPADGVRGSPFGNRSLISDVPDVTRDDSELLASFQTSPTKVISRGYVFLRSQDEVILGN
jgi:hypothetical protein